LFTGGAGQIKYICHTGGGNICCAKGTLEECGPKKYGSPDDYGWCDIYEGVNAKEPEYDTDGQVPPLGWPRADTGNKKNRLCWKDDRMRDRRLNREMQCHDYPHVVWQLCDGHPCKKARSVDEYDYDKEVTRTTVGRYGRTYTERQTFHHKHNPPGKSYPSWDEQKSRRSAERVARGGKPVRKKFEDFKPHVDDWEKHGTIQACECFEYNAKDKKYQLY
jgi:hypothetical protein